MSNVHDRNCPCHNVTEIDQSEHELICICTPKSRAETVAEIRERITSNELRHYYPVANTLLSFLDEDARKIEEAKQLCRDVILSNEQLEARLAKLANFNPDWDLLEATQESLREHMGLVSEARDERDALAKRVEVLEAAIRKAGLHHDLECHRCEDALLEALAFDPGNQGD